MLYSLLHICATFALFVLHLSCICLAFGGADTTAQFFLDLDLLHTPPCFDELEHILSTSLTSKGNPVKLPVTESMYQLLVRSNSTLASALISTNDSPAYALAEVLSVALRWSPACDPTDELTIAGKR
jgi:hypothetical protein